MNDLAKLFEPVAIGNVMLRNRLAMLAMGTLFGNGFEVNEPIVAFYRERAKGGVGLILVGTLPVYDIHEFYPNQISIFDDGHVAGLRQVTRAVQAEGAKAFAQLVASKHWRATPGGTLHELGPSDVKITPHGTPRPATLEEILHIIRSMADGARRAREAGFDGIEVHAGTGELVSQFLSPLTNLRTDEYGGSLENRARFLLEILAAVRAEVGPDFPITCKMGGDDFMPGGNKLDQAKQIAQILEKAGVQALNVAAGWHESPVPLAVSMVPQGGFAYLGAAVKEVVKVPVISTYRIADPLVAAKIIAEGKGDLIGMARAFLADPYWPTKVKEGRLDEIRPCLTCCRCLDEGIFGRPILCSVNPMLARESENLAPPASAAKKVFVAGGGPGGLQAAVTAASRGHDVTLFEKTDHLGGQLLVASVPPFKTELEKLVKYLSHEAGRVGVKVKLEQELTPSVVEQQRPDAVIVGTGAVPIIPDIPGVRGEQVVTANEVLSGARQVGDKVAVIGGGMVGCETAQYLAEQGKTVTIVEMLDQIAKDVGPSNRWVVRQELKKARVAVLTRSKAKEVVPAGVLVEVGEESKLVPADTVVLALGARSSKKLSEELLGRVDVLTLGDCVAPRRIREAIIEGFAAGASI